MRLFISCNVEGLARFIALPWGEHDLNWWRGVNDDWMMAGICSETNVQGMPVSISRGVSSKRGGSKINMLAKNVAAQNGDDVIWVAQDGSPRILLAYQTSIYSNAAGFWPQVDEVDVSTGKLRTVVQPRSEEHTSELQSLMRISYAVFCLKTKNKHIQGKQHEKK